MVEYTTDIAAGYGMTIFGPTSGERIDFLNYSMQKVLVAPMPDAEIAAFIRFIVLERHLKRIAIMVSIKTTLGYDLIPYTQSLLAEFGLQVTYVYYVRRSDGNPPKSIAEQAMEGLAKGVQAIIQLGAIESDTIEALAPIYSVMPAVKVKNFVVATPFILYPLLATLFSTGLSAQTTSSQRPSHHCGEIQSPSRPRSSAEFSKKTKTSCRSGRKCSSGLAACTAPSR